MSGYEAYRQSGYKGDPKHFWDILGEKGIREIVEERLTNNVSSIDDQIKLTLQEAYDQARNIMLHGENEFAKLKAAHDFMDRAGLKPKEKVDQNISGSIKIEFEYFDTPEEKDEDVSDGSETTPE